MKWYGCCLFFFLLVFPGCRVHRQISLSQPNVCLPPQYEHLKEQGDPEIGQWWQAFQSPSLNNVVDAVLRNNIDLKTSWWKVVQACAKTRIEASARWPEYIMTPSILHSRSTGGAALFDATIPGGDGEVSPTIDPTQAITSPQASAETFYLISNAVSYEIDLWRRIDSKIKESCQNMYATREDLEATALTLTGTTVDLWFTIQEQETLLEVIDHQIKVSKTQLELIELRFSLGVSTALDVYQQRLQLSATEAEKPPIESLLQTSQNRMRVLMGSPPENACDFTVDNGLVNLPPFPHIGTPCDLLSNRPDLRAQYRRILAADYGVAAAIADLFPRLDINISLDFIGTTIKNIFNERFSEIFAALFTPVFDGWRRRSEVKLRRAMLCELVSDYGQQFLNALLEVEDALVQEKYQRELIDILEKQIKIAKSNLEHAQFEYANGLIDYLNVIAAIQALQDLERRIVSEKKQLLLFRSKLYRSLGGNYLTKWG